MRYAEVHNWLQIVQGWLLPPRCVLCGSAGRPAAVDLCSYCADELVANPAGCRGCATPLANPGDGRCGGCMRDGRAFDTAFAPYLYEYPVDRLIQRFKYQGELAVGRVLGELLASAVAARGGELPRALVPVPLARAKQRERGFNQALELARPVGRALGLPVRRNLCARPRATADQATLGARARRHNVRGAFVVRAHEVPKHVAIVDDVLTTGSTCEELARVLKRAGAERIEVWVVARASPRRRGFQ
jgi:ComF family protein